MSPGSFRRSLLVVLPLFAACMSPPQPISDADKTALRAGTDKFAQLVLAKDWAGVGGLYSMNATFMPPNQAAVSGRAAIQAWMAAFPPLSSFKLTVQEVDGVGDLGYERGTYEITFTPPGASAPVTDRGKFLNVNRRNADGTWSLTNDTFNSDLPVAAPPPMAAPAKHK